MSEKYGVPPRMSGSSRLKEQKTFGRRRLRNGLATALAGGLGFLATWWWGLRPDPGLLDAPALEIVGTWVTDDPRYAGRAIVIGNDGIQLRTGQSQAPMHRFDAIRRTSGVDGDMYELTYFTAEGTSTLELHLGQEGTATLRNPPDVVWVRTTR